MQNPTSTLSSLSHRSSNPSTHSHHQPEMSVTQHPLPTLPSTQYADDEHLYGPERPYDDRHDLSGGNGGGYRELVPDSQADEGDEGFMQDMQGPPRGGEQDEGRYREEERYYQHGQEGGYTGYADQGGKEGGQHQGEGVYHEGGRTEGGALGLYDGYDYLTQDGQEGGWGGEGGDGFSTQMARVNVEMTQVEVDRGGGGGRRTLQSQLSIRMADAVEEPMTPGAPIQTLPHTQAHPEVSHSSPHHAQAIATPRAKGQFVPPQRSADSASNEHVAIQNVAGRRIITKQVGKKRSAVDEEEEEDVGRPDEPAEKFDPTAEIVKFDTKKMLVEDWDKIMKEIGPFLREYCTAKIQATFDEIHYINNLFHQLNDDARMDLEEGVKKIEEEEKKQEDCRTVIVNFSAQMEAVAAALSQFGGGAASVHFGGQAGKGVSA